MVVSSYYLVFQCLFDQDLQLLNVDWLRQIIVSAFTHRLHNCICSSLPGDDYNEKADPWQVLERHGWRKTGRTNSVNVIYSSLWRTE